MPHLTTPPQDTHPCSQHPHINQRNEVLGTEILYRINIVDNDGYAHRFVIDLDAAIDHSDAPDDR